MSKETESHNEQAPAQETGHGNEATKTSSSWLGQKVDRWLGHGARTYLGEVIIHGGSRLTTAGALSAVGKSAAIAPAELALAATGLGIAVTGGGALAEWHMGMKHAKSQLEKGAFWLSKIGQAVSPFIAYSNPGIAAGLFLAGTAMAFGGMTHRGK